MTTIEIIVNTNKQRVYIDPVVISLGDLSEIARLATKAIYNRHGRVGVEDLISGVIVEAQPEIPDEADDTPELPNKPGSLKR